MRKTLFGMAGAAALVFSFEARADNEVNRGQAAVELNDHEASPAIAYRGEASTPSSPERGGLEAEPAKPCQPGMDEGSASGEPSTATERSRGTEELQRDVWSAP